MSKGNNLFSSSRLISQLPHATHEHHGTHALGDQSPKTRMSPKLESGDPFHHCNSISEQDTRKVAIMKHKRGYVP